MFRISICLGGAFESVVLLVREAYSGNLGFSLNKVQFVWGVEFLETNLTISPVLLAVCYLFYDTCDDSNSHLSGGITKYCSIWCYRIIFNIQRGFA